MKRLLKKLRYWLIKKLGGMVFDFEIKVNPAERLDEQVRAYQMHQLHEEYRKLYGDEKVDKILEYLSTHHVL